MRKRLRHRAVAPQELNITAFMNLMVVLVPFLLLSAVFSQISILDLNLPSEVAPEDDPSKKPPLILEVIVRGDELDIADQRTGRIKRIPTLAKGHDFESLLEKLKEIKKTFPDIREATVLLEPDIEYDVLIQVMDTVRSHLTEQDGKKVPVELFPEISIGDAPPRAVGLQQ